MQDELDELLAMGDSGGERLQTPFFSTIVGWLVLLLAALVVLAGLAAIGIGIAWRRGQRGLAGYQRPYAQLIRLGRWSGTLRAHASDTPLELASRLARQVPRAQPAIEELTDAYVEGTYANRKPSGDPWPTWLAARRAVIRGLFSRRLGGWFGIDESVALAPRAHPELLKRWGARQRRPPG
jgi:hypothetical protein